MPGFHGGFERRLAAASLLLALCAGPAGAQKAVAGKTVDPTLTWTAEQQLARYPAMETVYEVATIRKGGTVRELPAADRSIDPPVSFAGRTQSIAAFMDENRITGLIAVKDGEILLERYALGRTADDRWTSFSVAKSVTSTLIGAAVKDGVIGSIDDSISRYITELSDSSYDGVSLRQVMTMTSGVKWNEDYADPNSDVALSGQAPFNGRDNPLVAYMAKLEREAEPGTTFVYKTGETDLAGIALSRALGDRTLSQYASEKIWGPFGMEQDAIWMLDKAGHERGGCCMSMTLRDYARLGLFMLGGGKIDGRSILPDGWVEEATTNQLPASAREDGDSYGYFWWPMDAPNYRAAGIFGQGIHVFPKENLVIAITSAMTKASDRTQNEKVAALVAALREAAKGR